MALNPFKLIHFIAFTQQLYKLIRSSNILKLKNHNLL